MKIALALLSSCLCLTSPQAAEVYRWVDGNGRTQYSDIVPQQYRDSARRVNTAPAITDEAVAEAHERANRERLEARDAVTPSSDPATMPGASGSGTGAPAGAPAAGIGPDSTLDCAGMHQAYRESQECFAPFRTVTGAVKPEAFNVCGAPVLDPSPQCGPPPAY
jgi:hypothetical protein